VGVNGPSNSIQTLLIVLIVLELLGVIFSRFWLRSKDRRIKELEADLANARRALGTREDVAALIAVQPEEPGSEPALPPNLKL
jgi:hypothetical protein